MDHVTPYEEDIYAWSREQAAVLRALAATRRDLPNELDLEHVAEEIEDVGSSELHRVESFIELLLIHLLKIASVPEARPVRHWSIEVDLQHRSLMKEYRRSMRRVIDLEDLWGRAVLRAEAALDGHGDTLSPGLPERCPFALEELVAPDFDPDRQPRWTAIRNLTRGSAGPR